jgi:lipopolysaccharide export LptBFGC system permease protein LptF
MMYNQFPVSSNDSKKRSLAVDLKTSDLTATEKSLEKKKQSTQGDDSVKDKASRTAEKAKRKAASAGGSGKKHMATREEKIRDRREKERHDWDKIVNTKMREALVVANKATFYPDMDKRLIQVELTSGSMHITDPDDTHAYDTVRFDKLTKGIVPSFDKFDKGSFEKDPREMSNAELRNQISVRDKGRRYSVELYRRFSIPLACLAFALIALPLAVYVRPTGKAVAFAISFLLILVYYGLLEYGTALGQTNSPFGPFTIFFPNLLLSGVGAVLLYRMVMK